MFPCHLYKWLLTVLVMLTYMLWATPLWAQDIALFTNSDSIVVEQGFYYTIDQTDTITFDDILRRRSSHHDFIQVSEDLLNLGIHPWPVWLHLVLDSSLTTPSFLELSSASTTYIRIYAWDGMIWHQDSIDVRKSFNERQVKVSLPSFSLPIGTKEILLSVRSTAVHKYRPRIVPADVFWEQHGKRDVYFGLYFGLVVFAFLYNLFIWVKTRELIFFTYCVYVLGVGLINLQISGYAFRFIWPSMPIINHYLSALYGLSVFSLLFTNQFLGVKKLSGLLFRLSLILACTHAIPVAASLIGLEHLALNFSQYVSFLTILLILVIAIWAVYHKVQSAWSFLVAWTSLLLGAFVFLFSDFSMVPYNLFTANSLVIGSAVEIVLLSLAMADAINRYKREYVLVKSSIIEHIEQKAKMAEEYSVRLENEVNERTTQLLEINTILNNANRHLSRLNTELNEKNSLLVQQKDNLVRANVEITSSIQYASLIQSALFPPKNKLDSLLNEYFIFHLPKDIVSGDFYWAEQVGDKTVIVIGDCTGHGVPGAFMSLLAISGLSALILHHKIMQPSTILQQLDGYIRKALNQAEGSNRDGLDIAVCVLDEKAGLLDYAGAMIPLYVVQEGQFIEYKANRQPIGSAIKTRHFEQHRVGIGDGTMLYLATDGYQDQFGGDGDRKFMMRKFRELLHVMSPLSMQIQERELARVIHEWKGSTAQVDDILVFGMRIKMHNAH